MVIKHSPVASGCERHAGVVYAKVLLGSARRDYCSEGIEVLLALRVDDAALFQPRVHSGVLHRREAFFEAIELFFYAGNLKTDFVLLR